RLKYWTARSCLSAASRVLKVPRFRLFPVIGFFLREYNRYWPDLSFLIIAAPFHPLGFPARFRRPDAAPSPGPSAHQRPIELGAQGGREHRVSSRPVDRGFLALPAPASVHRHLAV